MSREAIPAWLMSSTAEYVRDRIEAGDTPEAAAINAADEIGLQFPGGIPAPGHHVFDVIDDDRSVGYLWIGPRSTGTPEDFWVWDIEIGEQFRGNGFGRAAMLCAEVEARNLGALTLGLNVFGHNAVARRLYESLDYVTTAVQMRKDLPQ